MIKKIEGVYKGSSVASEGMYHVAQEGEGVIDKLTDEVLEWAVPVKQSLEAQISEIIEENDDVRKLYNSQKSDRDKDVFRHDLERYVAQSNKEYSSLLRAAQWIDTLDKLSSFDPTPMEELLEMVYKVPYIAYYTAKTGDYAALPLFAAYELGSAIPYIGDVFDLANIYVDRVKKHIRYDAASKFLASKSPEKMAKKSKQKDLEQIISPPVLQPA